MSLKSYFCNGYNHQPDCNCGWGGYGTNGGLNLINTSFKTADSLVYPNARCPVCNCCVFFYENINGSKVYFDSLGPPWPKHPCTNIDYSKTKPIVTARSYRLTKPKGWSAIRVKSLRLFEEEFFEVCFKIIRDKNDNNNNLLLQSYSGEVQKFFYIPRNIPFFKNSLSSRFDTRQIAYLKIKGNGVLMISCLNVNLKPTEFNVYTSPYQYRNT